jgi:hypothetical protein
MSVAVALDGDDALAPMGTNRYDLRRRQEAAFVDQRAPAGLREWSATRVGVCLSYPSGSS